MGEREGDCYDRLAENLQKTLKEETFESHKMFVLAA